MRRHEISDAAWERIEPLLPGRVSDVGVTAADNRLFIDAVYWIVKTGAPWRDLPPRFGRWNSALQRFNRWPKKGVWRRLAEVLSDDSDLEPVMIDSTVVQAHQNAAGQKGGRTTNNLDAARGGFSTKVHVAVDGLGNPVRFVLSPGQAADVTNAPALLEGLQFDALFFAGQNSLTIHPPSDEYNDESAGTSRIRGRTGFDRIGEASVACRG